MTIQPRIRNGLDRAFIAVVRPPSAADVEHEVLPRLRAACDAVMPKQPRTRQQAIAFLRELNILDQHHAREELDDEGYTRLVDALHRSVSLTVWMPAVNVSRLAHLDMACRQARTL